MSSTIGSYQATALQYLEDSGKIIAYFRKRDGQGPKIALDSLDDQSQVVLGGDYVLRLEHVEPADPPEKTKPKKVPAAEPVPVPEPEAVTPAPVQPAPVPQVVPQVDVQMDEIVKKAKQAADEAVDEAITKGKVKDEVEKVVSESKDPMGEAKKAK